TWNEVDRATAHAGGSGGPSFPSVRTAARHSPGRGKVDWGQTSDWSRKKRLFPPKQLDREQRISEFGAYRPVYRSSWVVEFRRIAGAAHLQRRTNSVQCKVHRGAATGSRASLPANHPTGF